MRDEDTELAKLEAMLRAVDPGRDVARELSKKRRDRVMWAWRHPFGAWCMRHHRALAWTLTALAVAGIVWCLLRTEFWEKPPAPEDVSPPVGIGTGAYTR